MLLIDTIGQLLCMTGGREGLGLINNAAILVDGKTIHWCGPQADMPSVAISERIDAQNKVVLPGLIDCHSHALFAGHRAQEFQWRMAGESYQSIMARGGGIMSTVKATRLASDEELFSSLKRRADAMLNKGVTTLEAKSGYGLSVLHEMRMLQLLKKFNQHHLLDIHPTFLGAHVVPIEYKDKPQAYVDIIINEMLPHVAQEKLAVDCDVFCERGAFSIEDTRRIFKKAHALGFGLRAHLEQLSRQGSLELLSEFPIKSISHAEFINNEDIKILANYACVVELLPIAALFVRATNLPPVKALRDAHVQLAIATDFNPGSAMCDDLFLAARLGVTLMGLSIPDALKSITVHAAQSLGITDRGELSIGKKADILLTNYDDMSELFYDWTMHPARLTIKNGQPVRKVHEESSCSSL